MALDYETVVVPLYNVRQPVRSKEGFGIISGKIMDVWRTGRRAEQLPYSIRRVYTWKNDQDEGQRKRPRQARYVS